MLIDFIIHVFASYCLLGFFSHRLYFTEALYLTLLIGLGKEQFFDVYYLGNDFSFVDLGGNIVGCILASIVTIQIK